MTRSSDVALRHSTCRLPPLQHAPDIHAASLSGLRMLLLGDRPEFSASLHLPDTERTSLSGDPVRTALDPATAMLTTSRAVLSDHREAAAVLITSTVFLMGSVLAMAWVVA